MREGPVAHTRQRVGEGWHPDWALPCGRRGAWNPQIERAGHGGLGTGGAAVRVQMPCLGHTASTMLELRVVGSTASAGRENVTDQEWRDVSWGTLEGSGHRAWSSVQGQFGCGARGPGGFEDRAAFLAQILSFRVIR